MSALQEFFNMGGHGGFIWPCYAATALVMITLLYTSLRRLRLAEQALAALEPHKAAAQRATNTATEDAGAP